MENFTAEFLQNTYSNLKINMPEGMDYIDYAFPVNSYYFQALNKIRTFIVYQSDINGITETNPTHLPSLPATGLTGNWAASNNHFPHGSWLKIKVNMPTSYQFGTTGLTNDSSYYYIVYYN
jgi:hypothetical protein